MSVNIFDVIEANDGVATASGRSIGKGVDNSKEGICPKCNVPQGTARITTGTVYYCTRCRVCTPIATESA